MYLDEEKEKKVVVTGNEAKVRLVAGVNRVANIVKTTLGPKGKNVILQRPRRSPLVTNDGVTIADSVCSDDVVENLGIQTLIDVARKTNDTAGDGTTTSIVIAQSIINEHSNIDKNKAKTIGGNSGKGVEIYKEIQKSKDLALDLLDKMAKPVKTIEEVEKVAMASLEDEFLGKMVAEMVMEVGENGRVLIEEGYNNKIETEIVKGMRFYGKAGVPFFQNNRKESIFTNIEVVVTNIHVEDPLYDLEPIAKKLLEASKSKFIVIAPKFSSDVLTSIALTASKNGLKIMPIKAPSLTEEQLEDVATYCDAKFINGQEDMSLTDMELKDLGLVKKIVTTQDDTTILGGRGNVNERIKVLKEHMDLEKDDMFKKKIERRIASLASSTGIIRVSASTEAEKGYLKFKIEDAINATKCALEEGVVKGGGVALKEVAEKLGKENALYKSLQSPYNQIQENAGEPFEVSPDIVDPVKVTKSALENLKKHTLNVLLNHWRLKASSLVFILIAKHSTI
jgi:chaperonin GroEL